LGAYQRLIRYKTGPDVEPSEVILVPDLAESWKVSEDGKTYTFHLRKGVKWQNLPPLNGREFVAEDVVWTYDRIAKTPGSASATWFDPVDKIRAVDRYTVEIVMKEPYVAFLVNMADPYAVITPKEVVDADGSLKKRAIGTGPFILTERVSNIVTKLRRNPGYWEPGIPYLDGVDIFNIVDLSAQVAAFRASQIDHIGASDKGDLDSILRAQPNTQVLKHLGLGWCKFHMRADKPPWDNIKLRQAFAAALDRQAEIDTFYSGEGRSLGPLPPYSRFEVPIEKLGESSRIYKRDVKYAKQLLAEAGYPAGVELPFLLRKQSGFTERIIRYNNDLMEANIKLLIKVIDNAEYLATGYIGKYEGAAAGCTGAPADPGEFLALQYHSSSTVYNQSHVKDALVDKMIDEQRRTLDEGKRIKIIQDLQMYLADKFFYIPLTQGYSYSLTSSRLKGYTPTISFNEADVYRYTWLEGGK